MKALQAKVRSDEPGNKLYALHKTADVNVYVNWKGRELTRQTSSPRSSPG